MATNNFITDEKLLIVGAGGMIGSNMAMIAAMLRLTPNVCLYDVYEPGNNGAQRLPPDALHRYHRP